MAGLNHWVLHDFALAQCVFLYLSLYFGILMRFLCASPRYLVAPSDDRPAAPLLLRPCLPRAPHHQAAPAALDRAP